MKKNNVIPKGVKVEFEDDIVGVYDSEGNLKYYGDLDCCTFKDDFDDNGKWNEKEGCYDLSNGYKLVGFGIK